MLGVADARAFLIHRAWRLLPLFITASVVGYAVRLGTAPNVKFSDLVMTLTTATMLSWTDWFPPVNGPIQADPFTLTATFQYWVCLLFIAFASYRFIEFPRADWRQLLLHPSYAIFGCP
jgi:hypothetical protein